jgi:hypothetical protein
MRPKRQGVAGAKAALSGSEGTPRIAAPTQETVGEKRAPSRISLRVRWLLAST